MPYKQLLHMNIVWLSITILLGLGILSHIYSFDPVVHNIVIMVLEFSGLILFLNAIALLFTQNKFGIVTGILTIIALIGPAITLFFSLPL